MAQHNDFTAKAKDVHCTWEKAVRKDDITIDEMIDIYNTWEDYDKDVQQVYNGPQILTEFFDKHARAISLPKDAYILDVAAGTGTLAIMLKEKYGYIRFDAMDASRAMLDQAIQKGAPYKNIYCCRIGDGYKLPIANDVYDAAVMCGATGNGHIKCDAFLEFIRVVKPGGLVVHVMREKVTRENEEYRKLLPFFKLLVDEKRWECIEQVNSPIKYYGDDDGLVQVYRIL